MFILVISRIELSEQASDQSLYGKERISVAHSSRQLFPKELATRAAEVAAQILEAHRMQLEGYKKLVCSGNAVFCSLRASGLCFAVHGQTASLYHKTECQICRLEKNAGETLWIKSAPCPTEATTTTTTEAADPKQGEMEAQGYRKRVCPEDGGACNKMFSPKCFNVHADDQTDAVQHTTECQVCWKDEYLGKTIWIKSTRCLMKTKPLLGQHNQLPLPRASFH